ncbi:hypothetical protein AAD018_001630 [Aestuariibius insulae]
MRSWVLIGALVASSEAAAFSAPAGCEGKLTIQFRNCLMTNIWTCEADPDGEQWMALFNETGPSRLRKVDAEFQWLETHYFSPIRTERMVVPAEDPEDMTELFANGYDTYDFTIRDADGNGLRYVGYDKLTGEETVVDGEVLRNTEYAFDVMTENGIILEQMEGRQFVSEAHRIFLFGESWQRDAPDLVRNSSPVDFIYPGEPGFFPNRPIYDCGAMLSSWEVSR